MKERATIDRTNRYEIVRHYQGNRANKTLFRGFTLEQAQAHCRLDTTRGPRWADHFEHEGPSLRTSSPQLIHDAWRKTDRLCRFTGNCVSCGRRTYAFDDGENDPRGMLGDNTCEPLVAEDYDAEGKDVPLCAICANEERPYHYALEAARKKWKAKQTA